MFGVPDEKLVVGCVAGGLLSWAWASGSACDCSWGSVCWGWCGLTARVWDRVEDIPAGVKAVDKDGHPVVSGQWLQSANLIEFENDNYAPFTEVVA